MNTTPKTCLSLRQDMALVTAAQIQQFNNKPDREVFSLPAWKVGPLYSPTGLHTVEMLMGIRLIGLLFADSQVGSVTKHCHVF
jgi:hypothetical protein